MTARDTVRGAYIRLRRFNATFGLNVDHTYSYTFPILGGNVRRAGVRLVRHRPKT